MNYSEILNGTEYDFLKTNEHLGKHVILLGLAGSYSYGTNIETSDIDLRGITLNQKSDLIGLTSLSNMWMRIQILLFMLITRLLHCC